MIKVKVKSDQIVTIRGINYYGGQEIEIPNSMYASIKDKVDSPMDNLDPILPEEKKSKPKSKPKPKSKNKEE